MDLRTTHAVIGQSPTADDYEGIAIVRQMAIASNLTRCLQAVVEFGVADTLTDEPLSADEIARRTGLDARATDRVLRLLAAHGVFRRDTDGYSHNSVSRVLRADHPFSLRPYVRYGRSAGALPSEAFEEAVRHGRPTVDFAQLEAWFAEHPDHAAMFEEAMASHAAAIIPAMLDAIDFDGCRVVADIGGGQGHVLDAILERHPDITGILFDLPHVIARCKPSAPERTELVAGDFFADALPTADTYLVMCVIHDWADDDAFRLLGNLRAAAEPGARLLVVDTVLSDEPGPDYAKSLDVLMLAATGGGERTATEYRQLLASTAFDLRTLTTTPAGYAVIEATAT
jgi:hypothetical protein